MANFKTPDFTYDPNTDLRAGVRPHRRGTYRLEAITIGNKLVIHNYGHGGGGITMALGCAHEVRDMVRDSGQAPTGTGVAVLGGGIMGLTAATLLQEMQLNVTMYAEKFTNTTSDIAGGQWSPSIVERASSSSAKAIFDRILTRAYRGYEDLMPDADYGISRQPNFVHKQPSGFRKVPSSLFSPVRINSLPFDGHNGMRGFRYDTLLIEPPKFLGRLRRDLADQDVSMEEKKFSSSTEVMDLAETIVVNCTGLGSDDIWPDSQLQPIKGQLIFLPPQPDLPYLYSGVPQGGYIFPRSDAVVVGGTLEKGVNDDRPDPATCAAIIAEHKNAFAGRTSILRSAFPPRWILRDK